VDTDLLTPMAYEIIVKADEIIKERWKIKDGIADEYGYDVKALVAYLRAKKHEGDKQVVDFRSI
jgi:hypothetical protein